MLLATSRMITSSRYIVKSRRNSVGTLSRFLSSSAAIAFDNLVHHDVVRDIFQSYARSDASREEPFLSIVDMRDLLVSIGDHPSDARLRCIISAVDKDSSGTVELSEFMEGYRTVLSGNLNQEEDVFDMDNVVRAFCTIDRNGDGVISVEELTSLLATTGGNIGENEAQRIMERADTDENGVIDLPEFMALFTDPSARESFSWRLRSGFRAAFVVSGPQSGAEYLCERLVHNADMMSCDLGLMLREEVEKESPLGKNIAASLEKNWMVPSSAAIALLRKKLSKLPGSFVAINGFPRSKRNYRDFEKVCGTPEFSIFIDLPENLMIERLLEDKPEQLAIDIKEAETCASAFHIMAKPMLEHLHKSGVAVHKLDGRNSADDMWEELLSLEPLIRNRTNRGISSCFLAL